MPGSVKPRRGWSGPSHTSANAATPSVAPKPQVQEASKAPHLVLAKGSSGSNARVLWKTAVTPHLENPGISTELHFRAVIRVGSILILKWELLCETLERRRRRRDDAGATKLSRSRSPLMHVTRRSKKRTCHTYGCTFHYPLPSSILAALSHREAWSAANCVSTRVGSVCISRLSLSLSALAHFTFV